MRTDHEVESRGVIHRLRAATERPFTALPVANLPVHATKNKMLRVLSSGRMEIIQRSHYRESNDLLNFLLPVTAGPTRWDGAARQVQQAASKQSLDRILRNGAAGSEDSGTRNQTRVMIGLHGAS